MRIFYTRNAGSGQAYRQWADLVGRMPRGRLRTVGLETFVGTFVEKAAKLYDSFDKVADEVSDTDAIIDFRDSLRSRGAVSLVDSSERGGSCLISNAYAYPTLD